MGSLTIERHVGNLMRSGACPDTAPPWPPDVFAVVTSVLHRSGAYVRVLEAWPPDRAAANWAEDMRRVGAEWRRSAGWVDPAPDEVSGWWSTLLRHRSTSLSSTGEVTELWQALVQLGAAADEACADVGLPVASSDLFANEVDFLLLESSRGGGATLCRDVDDSLVRVLPKSHTPQSGATIRSLSRYLALVPHTEVRPHWYTTPRQLERHSLNLLLLPYPHDVRPADFHGAEGRLSNLPREFGFFRYAPARDRVAPRAGEALAAARHLVGRVDGLVLPELALDEEGRLALQALARDEGVFVIAGVGRRTTTSEGAEEEENLVYFHHTGSLDEQAPGFSIEFEQHKHHRWKLDRSQVVQYGLGGRLDPARQWWEATALRPRSLRFLAMETWLTMCVLVCEDLARQDPVAQLVRAVGPNLVLALLLDGPQSAGRWPARYATVLAEDPGSSVLTLTSAGMANLARPPAGVPRSRSIALWKDPSGGTTEIDLPEGAAGVVLSMARERVPEWTADGRRHDSDGGRLVLAGQHAVRI